MWVYTHVVQPFVLLRRQRLDDKTSIHAIYLCHETDNFGVFTR